MVPTPEHNQTKPRGKAAKANEVRPRKESKPLNQYTFYLDIKNHNLSAKIESKIKELGGNVDLFLVKEVTHVVTDSAVDACVNEKLLPSTPLSSSCYSPAGQSSLTSIESPISPGGTKTSKRLGPKSRADAMLERARYNQSPGLHGDNSQHHPIDLARAWNIPIWHVEKVLKYLNKVSNAAKSGRSYFSCGLNIESRKLLGPHIKVESLERNFRPSYKYLRTWPILDTSGELGSCPFKTPKRRKTAPQKLSRTKVPQFGLNENIHSKKIFNDSSKLQTINKSIFDKDKKTKRNVGYCVELQKMTRKTRQRSRRKEVVSPQCGYCEICHLDYPDLASHARSGEHLNYVRNDSNFLTLDSLITAEANVAAFLKLNESTNTSVSKCNGFGKRSLRSVMKPQEVNDMKNSYDDPSYGETNFNVSHTRGSRKSSDKSIILNGNDINMINERHRLRSRAQLNIPNNLLGTTAEDICKSPKSNSPRESRSLKVTNCIKSEDDIPLDSLRSTKIKGIRWRCPSPETRPVVPASPSYKIVGSRLKTKEREAKSTDKGTGLVVKFKRIRQSELNVLSDEAENFMFPKRDDSSDSDSDYRDTSNLKIRSDASDTDADYTLSSFKLSSSTDDTPMRCTRQRLQNVGLDDEDDIKLSDMRNEQRFQLSPTQPPNETSVGDRVGLANKLNLTDNDIDNFRFSFEYSPNELWFHTYKRQDEKKELTFENSASGYSNTITKKYKLPYELGPLPPLKPNCCKLNMMSSGVDSGCNEATSERAKIKRRRRTFATNGKSRKSPREHASTLASLVQQRKKNELGQCGGSSDLTSITEEGYSTNSTPLYQSEASEPMEDPNVHDQTDNFLTDIFDDKSCFDIGEVLDEGIFLNARYEPTVNNLLETLSESTVLEEPELKHLLGMPTVKHDGRLRKKRKNNRTGWPKKKKFLPRVNKELEKVSQSSSEVAEESFVNAATQTSNCELTNSEIVLSIPVTDNSVNIVELSGEPLVVCTEHIDSCSNTTDSGKENHCNNDKTVTFDSSELFAKCKSNNSINPSDNFENHSKTKTEKMIENICISTSSSDDGQESSNLEWEENSSRVVPLTNIYKDDDSVSEDRKFQPFVCVQKIDEPYNSRRLRSSHSPQHSHNKKRRISCQNSSPVCNLSPRKLRAPRGRWYRER